MVFPFENVKFFNGAHVTSEGDGDKVVHRLYTLHTPSLGLPCPCPPIIPIRFSTVFSPGISLKTEIPGIARFNSTHSFVLHPLPHYT